MTMNENDKQAEPVAWRLNHGNGFFSEFTTGVPTEVAKAHWKRMGVTIEYAYLHPAPAVAQESVAFNGWYCTQCQCGVDPSEVTFHETHTVCGRYITDDVPPAPAVAQQKPIIELVDGQVVRSFLEPGYTGGLYKEAPAVAQEPVGEIQIEDMGQPFNAMRVRVHFYKEVPPVGAKIYTEAPAVTQPPADVVRELVDCIFELIEEFERVDAPKSSKAVIDRASKALAAAKEHGL